MDKIQLQLQEYRQRKLREDQAKVETPSPDQSSPSKIPSSGPTDTANANGNRPVIEPRREDTHRNRTWIDILNSFLVQLLVWLILLMVAVKFEFGIVYCILTGFYVIWVNLGRRRRNAEELSAYSVFNPNCERLPGTLTAEQLEGELLHRPM